MDHNCDKIPKYFEVRHGGSVLHQTQDKYKQHNKVASRDGSQSLTRN